MDLKSTVGNGLIRTTISKAKIRLKWLEQYKNPPLLCVMVTSFHPLGIRLGGGQGGVAAVV